MKVKPINIYRDMLFTIYALGSKKEKGAAYIKEHLLRNSNPSLIVFDLSEATIDHYFCEAFGDIYIKSFDPKSNLDLLFKLNEDQIQPLLEGILFFKKISYLEKNGCDIITYFIKNKLNIKLIINNKDKIDFISELDNDSIKVLEFIEKKANTNSDELYSHVIKSVDRLKPILDSLVKKRCIYRFEQDNYCSINYILKNSTT